MQDAEMFAGAPTVEEIPISQATIESPAVRMGDVHAQLEAQGMTVNEFFGGNEPRVDASIARGDWGQNDRGFEDFVPTPPPIPGDMRLPPAYAAPAPRDRTVHHMQPPQQGVPHEGPPLHPAAVPNQQWPFVDPTTTSPHDDAAMAPPLQQAPPQQFAPQQMTQEEYLRRTGNYQPPPVAPVAPQPPMQTFGQARTPGEITRDQEIGRLRNEFGEMREMLTTVIAQGGNKRDPMDQFAEEVGLNEYDVDRMLTAGELKEVLGRVAGSLYNETRNMVQSAAPSQTPAVDPSVEAVKVHMRATQPWLANLDAQAQDIAIAGMLGQGGQPPVPQGGTVPGQAPPQPGTSVQHHGNVMGQRPMTFVEHGSSVTQQDMGPPPRPRETMADVIALKKSRGQHVSTAEYAMALREKGLNVPIRR